MVEEETPIGWPYLSTFQAAFQLTELFTGLAGWALLASKPFFKHNLLIFAFAVLLLVWVITFLFFLSYITGSQNKINNKCMENGQDSVTDPQFCCYCYSSETPWLVVEYSIYLVVVILLLAAMIAISIYAHGPRYIASAVLGWITFLIYFIHYIFLVRHTEGMWPHEIATKNCSGTEDDEINSDERQKLIDEPTLP